MYYKIMIWAKLHCHSKFFWAGTAMVSSNVFFFVIIFINLLWGYVNNGQPLHELHNNKSLRTPDIEEWKPNMQWKNIITVIITKF